MGMHKFVTLPRRIRPLALCLTAVLAGFCVLISTVPGAQAANPSGWNIITTPDTGSSTLLMGTTCANAWECWAVGGAFSSLGNNSQPGAIAERWNGSSWSIGPDVAPGGTEASLLWGVTCVTSSDCWAVGAEEVNGTNSPVTMAEHWNGSAWSVVPTPVVSGYLLSVTCADSTSCVAVGTSLDGKQNALHGIIYQWNGSRWSQASPPSSGQTYDQFNAVTCTSPSDCWAVGFAGPNQIQYGFLPGDVPNVAGSIALVEHWNGSEWSIVTPPAATGPLGQYLSGVTCAGPSDCWAVGSTMDASGNPTTTLIDQWNGSAWTTTASPNPTGSGNTLTAVTCTDASACWATGATNVVSGQNNNNGSQPSPFIEAFNGSAWSVEPTPNVIAFGYLSGLTCAAGNGCFATGFAANDIGNNTTLQALIEQLTLPPNSQQGLVMARADGGVFAFGNDAYHGSAGGMHLNQPVVGTATTPGDGGYWLVAADGGVFSFGNALFHGSTGSLTLNKPIVGMAATPDGKGYWLVAADGGVFSFGDATFYGSTGSLTLNKPIVGMAATPDGKGYWLVAADGGVFSFGDARFHGSTGSLTLAKPIVGMAATPDGGGYWLVGSDGGVFSFGNASFHGSVPGQGISGPAPIVGMVTTPDGFGYWIVGQNGALYAYGDARYLGSLAGYSLAAPVVAAA